MCEVGNLIDLTPGEEPGNEEPWFEESEDSIAASNSFKGPYDPFDSMEKEACAKGIALKSQIPEDVSTAEAQYPDLNNESPPVCLRRDSVLGITHRQGSCTTTTITTSSSSSFQKQLLKLNATRSAGNQSVSKIGDGGSSFERTILSENQQMLSAESPLKLVEDDDVISGLKFEQDLQMLRISSLDEHTPSTKTEDIPLIREDPPKDEDAAQLLQRLRTLIHQVVEQTKWHLFDEILEAMASRMGCGAGSGSDCPIASPSVGLLGTKEAEKAAAMPYTRQGTFDLDLQETWKKAAVGQQEEGAATQSEGPVPGSKIQDFPDAMTCSAATFDGEPRFLEPTEPLARKEFTTELVDDSLALQINELLVRHKLGQTMVGGDHEQPGCDQRTVILLVNPSSYGRQPKSPSSGLVQPNPMPLGVSNDADSMRRRSSSLSIHDKPKQRKPMMKSESQDENQQNLPPREVKSTAAAPPLAMPNAPAAPGSFRQRRNSFSTASNPPTKIGDSWRLALDRTPSINESVAKSSRGAMIPTKRVAPIVKLPPAESTSLNPQARHLAPPRSGTVPETPLSSRSKPPTKIFATSTPLPQMRSQPRRSLKPVVGQGSSMVSANAAAASSTTSNFRRPSFSKKPGTG